MSEHTFRLPDLGEGTVSAEIVSWLAKPGDLLREDQPRNWHGPAPAHSAKIDP